MAKQNKLIIFKYKENAIVFVDKDTIWHGDSAFWLRLIKQHFSPYIQVEQEISQETFEILLQHISPVRQIHTN